MWTAFDYMYRDAGNFKAFGTAVLDGALTSDDEELIRSRLASGEYFIAEQIGIPPLYQKLYKWSGGRTPSDHCWHEFVRVREIPTLPAISPLCLASNLVSRFAGITRWDETLSPHFSLA
jgi:hypothetical protein